MPVDLPERVDPAELAEQRREHAHVRDRDLVEIALLEPRELQDPERLVVERDGARRHEDVRGLVDDEDPHAVAAEQIGDRRADRAVADHQNVDSAGRPAGAVAPPSPFRNRHVRPSPSFLPPRGALRRRHSGRPI